MVNQGGEFLPLSHWDLQVLTELTSNRMFGMFFHMKTTLNIDRRVMVLLKQEAARQGKTMSELVETALRRLIQQPRDRPALSALPCFRSGGHRVDIADREALYQAME